jgi:hypothetical protein
MTFKGRAGTTNTSRMRDGLRDLTVLGNQQLILGAGALSGGKCECRARARHLLGNVRHVKGKAEEVGERIGSEMAAGPWK